MAVDLANMSTAIGCFGSAIIGDSTTDTRILHIPDFNRTFSGKRAVAACRKRAVDYLKDPKLQGSGVEVTLYYKSRLADALVAGEAGEACLWGYLYAKQTGTLYYIARVRRLPFWDHPMPLDFDPIEAASREEAYTKILERLEAIKAEPCSRFDLSEMTINFDGTIRPLTPPLLRKAMLGDDEA